MSMYRVLQTDIRHRESINWMSLSGSSPKKSRTLWKRGRQDCRSQGGLRTPRELNQVNSLHMGWQWLKLKGADLNLSAPSPVGMLWLSAWCFIELLMVGVGVCLTLFPALGTPFPVLGCLVCKNYLNNSIANKTLGVR